MANGRGAWNVSGAGGTKKYKDATRPGPYYYLGTGKKPVGRPRTNDEYAVHLAVVAYQRALRRRLKLGSNILIDGVFGRQTSDYVLQFQNLHPEVGVWGGIGPDTSEALLKPDLINVVKNQADNALITPQIVSGTIRHESLWDAGAVGYLDPTDLGLAQINGPSHPDLTVAQRLAPLTAFAFVVSYYEAALIRFDNNVRDAIASYNLGAGGTRSWIADGRPDIWTPTGQTRPRNVKEYIDSILAG